MSQVLLTFEEIREAARAEFYGSVLRTSTGEEIYQAVAKAQLKKVVEWGDGFCNVMGHNTPGEVVFKRRCPDCWQALLKEVKDAHKD